MRFWLSLISMLLSLATANAQCVVVGPGPDGQPAVRLCPQERPPECDHRGCYFEELNRWRTPSAAQTELQRELQRRADEARKKLEADRKNSNVLRTGDHTQTIGKHGRFRVGQPLAAPGLPKSIHMFAPESFAPDQIISA